ncbi:hypothetical protein [Falsiroseomonas sp. HW251]|uniref:hypothetical protein n=1 Tax=Falsiroseomonas sp. HW251 TaxID=3390998 RepID=UPI003D31C9CF
MTWIDGGRDADESRIGGGGADAIVPEYGKDFIDVRDGAGDDGVWFVQGHGTLTRYSSTISISSAS